MTARSKSSLSSRFRGEHFSKIALFRYYSRYEKQFSKDRCDFNVSIPSSQLQLAVNNAFDYLGKDAKDSLLEHLQFQGINLADGSNYNLNQLVAALQPIFSKEATFLVIEMVWLCFRR